MERTTKIGLGIGCGLLLAVGVVIAGTGLLVSGAARTSAPKVAVEPVLPVAPASTPTYDLELVGDWRLYHDTAYAHAEGEVRNLTGRSLRAVQAVVTWYGEDGQLVTTADAIVEYNPMLPGQVAPWHVLTPWDKRMATAKLRWKLFTGETLAVRPEP